MNESMESGIKELGVVASQREEEVVQDTPGEDATQVSPFGSAAAVNEEEAVRELPPILDLPESETVSVETAPEPETVSVETAPEPETVSVETAPEPETVSVETAPEPEAPALETASVPAEEYEVPRMGEAVVEEPIPEVSSPTMSAEPVIQNDQLFGSFKRLLVDLIGED